MEPPCCNPDFRDAGSNDGRPFDPAGQRREHFPAHIVVVVSNRADAGGLETAEASGVPTVTIESKPFGKDRAAFEAVLQSALERHQVDLICLGGFMRLFTAEFVQRWYGPDAQHSSIAAAVISRTSIPRVRRCAPG